jgi:hypothetical protein
MFLFRLDSIMFLVRFDVEDGKVKYLLQQVPVRQLENQVGEILELVKWCKEER